MTEFFKNHHSPRARRVGRLAKVVLCALVGLWSAAQTQAQLAPDAPSVVSPVSSAPVFKAPALTPDRSPDRWASSFKDFDRADADHPSAPGGVVFVGSSSIRLWTDLEHQFTGWPTVIKRGFGGSELADCARHVQRLVSLYQPRLVLVYAGDNDLAAGRLPQQVLESYQAFVGGVHERQPGLPVAFISIKPSPSRAKLMSSVRETNRLIREYTDSSKNLYFVDVFTPMLGPDGEPRAELFKPDALHLNPAGYALWRSVISKTLPPSLMAPMPAATPAM